MEIRHEGVCCANGITRLQEDIRRAGCRVQDTIRINTTLQCTHSRCADWHHTVSTGPRCVQLGRHLRRQASPFLMQPIRFKLRRFQGFERAESNMEADGLDRKSVV